MRDKNSRSVGHGALDRPPKGAALTETPSAIPDVLGRHLRVLFCGINPGRVSAAAQAHFANPRNDFWRLLHAARLHAAAAGAGRAVRAARRRDRRHERRVSHDARLGRPAPRGLRGLARSGSSGSRASCEPGWLAFVGKEAYRGAFNERPELGVQERTLGETRLFVLPSTSPANAAVPWAERLHWFQELAAARRGCRRASACARARRRRATAATLLSATATSTRRWWITPGGGIGAGRDATRTRCAASCARSSGSRDFELGPLLWTREHVVRATSPAICGQREQRLSRPRRRVRPRDRSSTSRPRRARGARWSRSTRSSEPTSSRRGAGGALRADRDGSPTGRSTRAAVRQRFVIGVRRSRPNAFGRSLTPGGAWRRLYSARSISASARSTTSWSKPSARELLARAVELDVRLEHLVELRVRRQRVLVELVGAQLGARRALDGRLRDQLAPGALVQVPREPEDVRLVDVLEQREAAGHVAVERRVADRELRLVAGRDERASRTCSRAPSAARRGRAPAGSPR